MLYTYMSTELYIIHSIRSTGPKFCPIFECNPTACWQAEWGHITAIYVSVECVIAEVLPLNLKLSFVTGAGSRDAYICRYMLASLTDMYRYVSLSPDDALQPQTELNPGVYQPHLQLFIQPMQLRDKTYIYCANTLVFFHLFSDIFAVIQLSWFWKKMAAHPWTRHPKQILLVSHLFSSLLCSSSK